MGKISQDSCDTMSMSLKPNFHIIGCMYTEKTGMMSNCHVTTGEHNEIICVGERNAFSFESIHVAAVTVIIYFQDV